jgi:hypothetical protein
MEIKNIEGLSPADIRGMVSNGGKFVFYKYCISIILMTFNRTSDIYFVKPRDSRVTPGLGYLGVNLLLGWWGFPWGPIYTIGNFFNIVSGGKDVTTEILAQINQNDPSYGVGNSYNIPGQAEPSGQNQYNIPSHD